MMEGREGARELDHWTVSVLKNDMQTVMREFTRRLPEFKRMAAAGKRIRIIDRQGRRFVFEAEKRHRAYGAGRHLAKGQPLSAERTPIREWKGLE
jgi:hypothetical protein